MVLRNMRIGTRLAVGVVFILAILMVMVIVIDGDEQAAAATRSDRRPRVRGRQADAGGRDEVLALEQSSVMRNIGLHSDIKAMQQDEDRARAIGKAFDEAMKKMQGLAVLPEERVALENLARLDKALDEPFRQALGLSTSFRNEEAAQVLMADVDPVIEKETAELTKLIDIQKWATLMRCPRGRRGGRAVRAADLRHRRHRTGPRRPGRMDHHAKHDAPIVESVGIARRVASGDLTARSGGDRADEPADLQRGAAGDERRAGAYGHDKTAPAPSGSPWARARWRRATSSFRAAPRSTRAPSRRPPRRWRNSPTTVQPERRARQAGERAGGLASSTAERGGEVVAEIVKTMQEVRARRRRRSRRSSA